MKKIVILTSLMSAALFAEQQTFDLTYSCVEGELYEYEIKSSLSASVDLFGDGSAVGASTETSGIRTFVIGKAKENGLVEISAQEDTDCAISFLGIGIDTIIEEDEDVDFYDFNISSKGVYSSDDPDDDGSEWSFPIFPEKPLASGDSWSYSRIIDSYKCSLSLKEDGTLLVKGFLSEVYLTDLMNDTIEELLECIHEDPSGLKIEVSLLDFKGAFVYRLGEGNWPENGFLRSKITLQITADSESGFQLICPITIENKEVVRRV